MSRLNRIQTICVYMAILSNFFLFKAHAVEVFYDTPAQEYVINYVASDGVEKSKRFELPNKIDPFVTLSFSTTGNNLVYKYVVGNSIISKQNLYRFGIEFSSAFQIEPETEAIIELETGETLQVQIGEKVPVLGISQPLYWTANTYRRPLDTGLTLDWFWNAMEFPSDNIVYEEIGIKPGHEIGGFEISSNRPPSIAAAIFQGYKRKEPVFGHAVPHEVSRIIIERFHDSLHYVRISTLAPRLFVTSDLPSLCDTYILDLIGQVRLAADLGWIKHDLRKDRDDDDDHGKRKGDEKGKKKGHEKGDDEGEDNGDDDEMDDADKKLPGAAKSIIKKLTKVRRECMRGKFGNAREKLRALIRQVNAQRGKHLTEEAYALIKFNAEFLLEKI